MRRRALLEGLTGLAGTAVFGAPPGPVTPAADPVGALERALLDPPSATGLPMVLSDLRRQVIAARSVFQHGRYAEVAARLPELVSTAMTTHAEARTSEDLGAASGMLADIYTSTSRQAEFWAEVGRALVVSKRTREKGVRVLMHAEQLAPQRIRHDVFVHEAIAALLRQARREAGGRELRDLAWRMGVDPVG